MDTYTSFISFICTPCTSQHSPVLFQVGMKSHHITIPITRHHITRHISYHYSKVLPFFIHSHTRGVSAPSNRHGRMFPYYCYFTTQLGRDVLRRVLTAYALHNPQVCDIGVCVCVYDIFITCIIYLNLHLLAYFMLLCNFFTYCFTHL